ncbi:MAG: class I SAM-dependent methyltransferase [Promethearchaeota archaeon]
MSKIFLSSLYKPDQKSFFVLNKQQEKTKKEIFLAFKKGVLRWENYGCRCSTNDDIVLSLKERRGLNIRIVLCKNCGLVRQNPRISEDTILTFYEKFYRDLSSASKKNENIETHAIVFEKEKESGKRQLNIISRYTPLKKGVVFDFGTGTGGVLDIFKNEGFEIFGVDVNKEFLNYGVSQGLNLKLGSIDELLKYPKKANLIIASHILEHLHNIDDYIRRLWLCLEDNGYIFIELPGLFNVHKVYHSFLPYFVIEHLYYFNLNSLNKIMTQNGFKLIIGTEKIWALFQKTNENYKNTTYQENINNIMLYLQIVDLFLPINALEFIKSKANIKKRIIIILISIIYKARIINLLVIIKKFMKSLVYRSNLLRIVKKILFK